MMLTFVSCDVSAEKLEFFSATMAFRHFKVGGGPAIRVYSIPRDVMENFRFP